jgi:hypothetical protein
MRQMMKANGKRDALHRATRRGKARRDHLTAFKKASGMDPWAQRGAYAIDGVVEELRDAGIFQDAPNLFSQARTMLDVAAYETISATEFHLQRAPAFRGIVERFVYDLELISHLIERNEDRDPYYALLAVSPAPPRHWREIAERTEQLQAYLRKLRALIDSCLLDYWLPTNDGAGNHDSLSSGFIIQTFQNAWCVLRFGCTAPFGYGEERFLKENLPADHRRPFARFLAAAWRDLGFPLVDHRGQSREPLEDWFADRLRKDKRFLPGDDPKANSENIGTLRQ